jgi:hypothetical protein
MMKLIITALWRRKLSELCLERTSCRMVASVGSLRV